MHPRADLITCAFLFIWTLSALSGCAAEPEPIIIETPAVTLTAYVTPEPTAKIPATPRPSPTPEAPTATVPPARININTASARQLEALPRIGPSMAQRIVEYRQAHGAFASAEALMDVPGIGEATFAAIKELITIDD